MTLISVIIPAYNAQKTIKETIESVLKQTFPDFELIIINDGSQDSTLEIIQEIKDPRIRVFSYQNSRQAVSRNRGISRATGEYIAFLDADDLWTPDKLEKQLTALQTNPEAAVAYSWTNWIDESSQFLRRGSYLSFNGYVYPQLLQINFLENGSNPLIRREALETVGGFEPSLTPAEDLDLYLRLAARYSFVAVQSPQILYRVSSDSMSANLDNLESACLRVFARAYTDAPESLLPLKSYSLGNLYKYLTFKALAGTPKSKDSFAAAQYFWQAVKNDPQLLKARVSLKLLLQIATILILPAQEAQNLLRKSKLNNLNPLLGYIKLKND
ncbi:glycosyltransferase [Oscillatoria salina]|uniref:glycosyltransferase n=1 Tax=Oscillatoria salina TaxID=331517 RepID=UPI0013BE1B3C|nr:glycosyltransferase [Oscillatoria salina]MBZ8182200.1 glycosyltransferase [Oscillatoria salina IIICB1]NET89065.1 glycosyltransferase [Kamptonema sp. SIO1D9]